MDIVLQRTEISKRNIKLNLLFLFCVLVTPCQWIVDNGEDEEDGVNSGEGYEELVEEFLCRQLGQDEYRCNVTQDTE